MDPLLASLLDLAHELGESIPLTIGGGLGIFLKRQHLQKENTRTLFRMLPVVRSTRDIDLFLRADILTDIVRTSHIAEAIRRLGYEAIPGCEYMQWQKSLPIGSVKLDLLVGPLDAYRGKLQIDSRRVRPRGKSVGLHARKTEEAVGIDEAPLQLSITGLRSDGTESSADILVPSVFPYLMMKLFAFRDRRNDSTVDFGRHHCLDLYTIIGTMSEAESITVNQMSLRYRALAPVQEAAMIVGDYFAERTSLGLLRLREHPYFDDRFEIDEFIKILAELFPKRHSSHG